LIASALPRAYPSSKRPQAGILYTYNIHRY
jgi:hypothetical protein